MISSFSRHSRSLQEDPFIDLLWQENQESEQLEAKRHPSMTLSADIEAYLSSTH